MELYGITASSPCRAVLMTAKAVGIELNVKPLDMKNGEHLKPEYLKINPQHTIPTLVDNGFAVWESRAIMIYLVEQYAKTDSLYPKCPKKQGLVNQRLYFDMSLYSAFGSFYYPQVMKKAPADAELLKALETQLEFLNTFLDGQVYAVGDSLTVADMALLATISTMDVAGIKLAKYANIVKWYEHCKQVTPGFAENWEGCQAFKKYFDGL